MPAEYGSWPYTASHIHNAVSCSSSESAQLKLPWTSPRCLVCFTIYRYIGATLLLLHFLRKMQPTKYAERSIPRISLAYFDKRIDEITSQLVHAAETDGFFSLTDTEITIPEIETIFATSESFFALPDDVKATVPFTHNNVGWEKRSQIRPSTGCPDQKESYQLQFGENMKDKWIAEEALPEFKGSAQSFMRKAQGLSEKLMLCFARGLGFPDDYFIQAHDVSRPDCQSVLRLLHYFEVDKAAGPLPKSYYRAGAHADWDLLTLLFQRPGQSGLEICPGREVVTSFGMGDTWTKVEFQPGDIVCNIGSSIGLLPKVTIAN